MTTTEYPCSLRTDDNPRVLENGHDGDCTATPRTQRFELNVPVSSFTADPARALAALARIAYDLGAQKGGHVAECMFGVEKPGFVTMHLYRAEGDAPDTVMQTPEEAAAAKDEAERADIRRRLLSGVIR